ncbi:MAG: pyridoxal phosphate-dependent aminotransferase [Candidatus Marinimicrobia bacterium]|nr:pyridoxal phosphate-dependent aminotransferase [Candidatus Neomarinimicrobiota bacterium]
MSISQIARSLTPSATLKLNEKATIMRQRGDPVIHLGGGEPKSKAPFDAILATTGLLDSAEIRYSPPDGTVAMKKAIIRYTEEHYNRLVEPRQIIASNGAKQALMVALQAILNPHEEVIFPTPYWVSYPDMVKLCQGIPIPVLPEDGTFYPKLSDIEENVGSYTKAVIINSPNNPTGAVYSEEFIADIVEYCRKRDLYLIMDDIYNRLVFDNRKPSNCFDYVKDFGDNSKLILINGVSKQYAMTGFRIGWAIGNKNLIDVMINIQSHQTSGPPTISQKAAIGAINGVQSSVENLRIALENRRNIMIDNLNSFDGLKVTKPDGTFYCFVDFSHYNPNSVELSELLLEKVQVITVPGLAFGLDGYLRFIYCGGIYDIREGIERIQWVLDPDAPNELYIGERKLVRDW